jgi:hypothetical protein
MTGVCHCAQNFSHWNGFLWTFFFVLAWTGLESQSSLSQPVE